MGNIKLAGRYAKSLIDLAVEKNQLEAVYNDVKLFNTVVAQRDFYLMMKSPIVKADAKLKIFESIFSSKVSELTNLFFKIVINKQRAFYLKDIMAEFINQYNEIKGITPVKVTSAVAIDAATADKIKTVIQQNAGLKNIEMTTSVNENLVGGLVLEFNHKIFDASVAHDLKEVKKQFLDNVFVKKF